MIEKKHQALAAIHLLLDAIASNLALLLAYYLRFGVEIIPVTKGQQDLGIYASVLPLVTVIFPLVFAMQGLYRSRSTRSEEWISVITGTLLGTIVLSGVLLWIRPGNPEEFYSRATLGIFAVCEVALVMAARLLLRYGVERRHRAGKDLDRVLIAGNGELARAVAERLLAHQELGFEVVGYLEHEPSAGGIPSLQRLGSIGEASQVVRSQRAADVYVAIPHDSSPTTMALLDRLMRENVSIHVVPDLLQFMALRSRVEDIDGLPTINLSDTPLQGMSRLFKRSFDLALATAALVVLSPVMGLVALLIWLEDRGPVLYRQVRMGLDGAPFEMLKFRSMRAGAEAETGAVWAEKDDPRRTRIGALIRTWSLDELPQLWNVVRGDMSLVGPRPERPQFVEQFRSEFPHYMLRHKVRAGMTGWAQVHGWRGNTSVRIRIEHDLYYIENWSLLLDLKIIAMTLRHGLRHENAY
ncbi:MAG TPA: undecaprenyl-phosphate glucose phosphotransferase [Thermoanaerobaculia bacterium]|nr:undecaprenyl-phosphate glucose phosphotransferase [Thermoanaerobaculia bacterium]